MNHITQQTPLQEANCCSSWWTNFLSFMEFTDSLLCSQEIQLYLLRNSWSQSTLLYPILWRSLSILPSHLRI